MEELHPAPTPPTSLPSAPSPNPTGHRGQGFLAVAATLFLPGLGHALARRFRRALFWFALFLLFSTASLVCAGLPALVPALIVLVPLSLIVTLWNWVDAYRTGRRSTAPMLGRPWRRYAVGVLFIVAAVFFAPAYLLAEFSRHQWVQAFANVGRAMSPTIDPDDRLLVNLRFPARRWDIVVYRFPEDPSQVFIGRLVALPGETVEIINEELHVNGQPTPRPHDIGPVPNAMGRTPKNAQQGLPMVLAGDEYFILGDNSPIAGDSRYWYEPAPGHQPGALPADHILGPAIAIYWPPSRWRKLR